jgi:hypothetical protein
MTGWRNDWLVERSRAGNNLCKALGPNDSSQSGREGWGRSPGRAVSREQLRELGRRVSGTCVCGGHALRGLGLCSGNLTWGGRGSRVVLRARPAG